MVCQQIAVLDNGKICIVSIYDDDIMEATDFVTNLTGGWNVYKVEINENESVSMFAISFPQQNVWIFGESQRVQGFYLYERFIKSGVKFGVGFSRNKISTILFETFAPMILQTVNRIEVSALTGWQDGSYRCRSNFPYYSMKEFCLLPVMKKDLSEIHITETFYLKYFKKILKMPNKTVRVLQLLYPLAGIMNSWLCSKGKPVDFYINFIETKKIDIQNVCSCFQILNRHVLRAFNPDVSQKRLEDFLKCLKDEILIADFRIHQDSPYYKSKKIQNALTQIGDVLTRQSSLAGIDKEIYAAFVSISERWIFRSNALNIICDENVEGGLAEWGTTEGIEIISAILFEMVEFLQANRQQVDWIIQQKREVTDFRRVILEILYDIATFFWQNFGVDFEQETQIKKEELVSIFQDNFYDAEEVEKAFFIAVRCEAQKLLFVQRERMQVEGAVGYDDDFLYFRSNELKKILSSTGLENEIEKILLQLKARQVLKCGVEGFQKKIQVGGERFAVYQIERSFFNKAGLIDVVELGRGDC